MTFNESNTVEAFMRDRLCGGITHHTAAGTGLARRQGRVSGLGWHFLALQNLRRQPQEILLEDHLREALIRLNSEIAAQPDRADDVLYRLRAILMGVTAVQQPELWGDDSDRFLAAMGMGVFSAGLTQLVVLAVVAGICIRRGDRTPGTILLLGMCGGLFAFFVASFLAEV